jgi:hypothetical protein
MRALISGTTLAAMACSIAACKPGSAPPSAAAPAPATEAAPAPGWVVFETLPDATIYVDPSSIRREGNRAEMWVLIDYRSPQPDKTGKQVLSDKLRYEYDCRARQLSIIDTSAHAGPMASGETINVNPDPPQLTPVPAGTTAERMWSRACG